MSDLLLWPAMACMAWAGRPCMGTGGARARGSARECMGPGTGTGTGTGPGLIDELSHVVSSIVGREAIEQNEDERDPG